MRQRLGFITMLLTLLTSLRMSAQTTQPAPDPWGKTVYTFAAALLGSDPIPAVTAILPEDVTLREFGGTRNESRHRLVQRAEGTQLIATRAYLGTPQTVATDLAADIRACDSLPPSLRAPFLPRDDVEARKANAVAQQWVHSVLDPSANDLVGVIMLWEPPPAATSLLLSTTPAEPKQPIFIFIKGKLNDNGDITITTVCFGDAKQALK